MPEYVATCVCGKTFPYQSTIKERHTSQCECGRTAFRDVEAELSSVSSRKKWVTENERWSRSMGVPPASLAEYRKKFPNSTYSSDGRLLIKDRKDKLRQMKERDFVELNDRK